MGLTPSAFARALDLHASTLSVQLNELLNSGLISQQRNGRTLICRAAFAHMSDVLAALTANCSEGGTAARPS